MPLPQTLRSVLFAASILVFAPVCLADEVESTADAPAAMAIPAPTRSMFSSWFGPRADRDTPGAESMDADIETPHGIASFGAAHTSQLVVGALGLLGIGYRLGGSTPTSGFDCSGMVRYVFAKAMGLDLPRRAEEISRVGTRVDRNDLKPGDLVFYKTLRKTFSHVGIYLGNNRFIHAPSAGGAVRVDDMSQNYWTERFNGARRVN